jgi:hypothetical protein
VVRDGGLEEEVYLYFPETGECPGSTGGNQRSWTSDFSSEAERIIFGGDGVDSLRGLGGIGGGAGVCSRSEVGPGVT